MNQMALLIVMILYPYRQEIFYLSIVTAPGSRSIVADILFPSLKVEFKHNEYTDNDPNGRAQNHVRELFRRIIPAIVLRFFLNIHSKPHTMSLVARNVSPDHQQRYCQLFIINKLNIRVDQLLTPAGVDDACIDEITARYDFLAYRW